jgi:hypothetical protein
MVSVALKAGVEKHQHLGHGLVGSSGRGLGGLGLWRRSAQRTTARQTNGATPMQMAIIRS